MPRFISRTCQKELTDVVLFWMRTRSGTRSVFVAMMMMMMMTTSVSLQIFLATYQMVSSPTVHVVSKPQSFLMLGIQLAGSEIQYKGLLPPDWRNVLFKDMIQHFVIIPFFIYFNTFMCPPWYSYGYRQSMMRKSSTAGPNSPLIRDATWRWHKQTTAFIRKWLVLHSRDFMENWDNGRFLTVCTLTQWSSWWPTLSTGSRCCYGDNCIQIKNMDNCLYSLISGSVWFWA